MYYNQKNVRLARNLRKEMTPWERKLWYCILSKYEELDGGGHYDPKAQIKDRERTRKLEQLGMKVIRFCNSDVDKNFYGVCTVIDREVKNRINR